MKTFYDGWNNWIDFCASVLTEPANGFMVNNFLTGIAMGLMLALLCVLLLLLIDRRRRSSGILIQGETGSLFITPEAVRQFVDRTLDEVGDVKLRTMEMRQGRNGNCVMSLVVKIAADSDVQALVDDARLHVIKQSLAKLGMQGTLKVNITVRGFDRSLASNPATASRERSEEDMNKRHAMTGYPTLSE